MPYYDVDYAAVSVTAEIL